MSLISIIAPDKELASLCKKVVSQMNLTDKFSIRIGLANKGVAIAEEEKEKGAEAIISRGGTSILIRKESLDIPIIDIEVTTYDLICSLNAACKLGDKVAVIGFKNVIEAIEGIEKFLQDMMQIEMAIYKVGSEAEIEGIVIKACRQMGKEGLVFIGGNLVVARAAKYGCPAVIFKSTREGVVRAINEARLLLETIHAEKERTSQFKTILEFISDGVLAVNSNGQVTVYNKAAERIIGIPKNLVINKPVQEVIQNTRMHDVVGSGKEEIGVLQEIGNTTIVTNRTPIFVDQKIAGAVATFQNITQLQQLEQQVRRKLSRRGLVAKWSFNDIVGSSPAIKRTIKRALRFSDVDNTILIFAETGSGKEMFAQSIHQQSIRKNGPFVAINCAALPESLLEGELFGYAEGSFTGAAKGGKAGLFELAHGGSIFLDEIGEISKHLQTLFLRVLQEKEVRRVGDDRVIPIDVRVIVASNQKLSKLVEEGTFRADLYYRINVLNLEIPPLRERKEDIPLLVDYFLENYRMRGKNRLSFTPEAMELLQYYDWPGNVRQLENVMERLFAISENDTIDYAEVKSALDGEPRIDFTLSKKESNKLSLRENYMSEKTPGADEQLLHEVSNQEKQGGKGLLPELEKEITIKVLQRVNGHKQEAARILGISNTTLWRRMKKWGIDI